jgi:hypothetical protein
MGVGDTVVELVIDEGPQADGWSAVLCRSVVPVTRLESEAAVRENRESAVPLWISPAERFTIGLLAADAIADGAVIPEAVLPSLERLREAQTSAGDGWRDSLALAGAATPALTGQGRPWVGRWPAYEAIENEGPLTPVYERELVDLRLKVLDYLGRLGLPGETGGDLMWRAVSSANRDLEIETYNNWEGFLRWLHTLDDEFFDEGMRACFADGLYSAQF